MQVARMSIFDIRVFLILVGLESDINPYRPGGGP